MRKDNSNWEFFLERLLVAVILTYPCDRAAPGFA